VSLLNLLHKHEHSELGFFFRVMLPATTHGRPEASGIFTTTGRILILQQMKRKFWKIADALFRIS
jgi:hypothetical protein